MNEKIGSGGTLAVSVPGGELIGVRSGSGRPLLVLHGGPGVNDYSDWFAAALVRTRCGVGAEGHEQEARQHRALSR